MAKKDNYKAFLAELATFADEFRRNIEAGVDGFDPDPKAKLQRVERCRTDFEFFAKTYFPHYIKAENSRLHDYLYKRLPEISFSKEGEKDAIAAPRGEAKSTIVSQIWTIWEICYEYTWYIPIVMDAFEQAATMLEAIKAEFEENPRLAMDFPDVVGKGRVWRSGVILTRNNRKVQAFGSGKRMRGMRHGPHRPTKVVLDDIENDENVASPEQRNKLHSWLTKTVLKLGDADDSLKVFYVGTILHYDSVLARTLKNPLWRRRQFKGLLEWPHRMDLWDSWEEVLRNDGVEEALNYYEQRQAEMDKGALVSWPSKRPLYKLMVIRARDGHSAFDSEIQNDPVAGDEAIFVNSIHFWVNRLKDWVFYGACDPSLGKNNRTRNDPSALLVGGMNRATGVLDVVEARIAKRIPDKIISDIITLQREYRCLRWAIESVQFQEFLRTELVKRSAVLGVPVPAVGVNPHNDKDLRIESLQPHMANKLILLHPSQTTLIDQLRHYPKADHDDGPDALEMLWKIAVNYKSAADIRTSGIARAGRTMNNYVTNG